MKLILSQEDVKEEHRMLPGSELRYEHFKPPVQQAIAFHREAEYQFGSNNLARVKIQAPEPARPWRLKMEQLLAEHQDPPLPRVEDWDTHPHVGLEFP
jgi:hypothetical protein